MPADQERRNRAGGCHLPGEMRVMDGMLVPPSNTLVDQGEPVENGPLTRR